MNAVIEGVEIEQLLQQGMFGQKQIAKLPVLSRTVIIGGAAVSADPAAAEQVRSVGEAQRAQMDRLMRTPLVPVAWMSGSTQVTPEEAGERKSGRPRINTRRTLTVGDLDNSLLYLQRRTRDLQKLVRGTQPDAAHTTRIVTAAIKDAVRRLCANLPEEKREAIDEAVARF